MKDMNPRYRLTMGLLRAMKASLSLRGAFRQAEGRLHPWVEWQKYGDEWDEVMLIALWQHSSRER